MATSPRQRQYTPDAKGPLDGVRVLDLSRLVAGNMLTQVLGDFGAEVIKVEPPAGDTLRAWKTEGVATNWKIFARSKKSLGLDLRHPDAKALLLALVPTAAIFVESFRPGTLEKMGLAPQRLFEANPRLVIVRISGWGQTGPYKNRPGFGTLVEGMSGFASMNGFPDREPVLPPMYDVLGRQRRGVVWRVRRDDCVARSRGQRRRWPGDRPAAFRSALRRARVAGGELPSHGQGEGARRQRLHEFRAA